MTTPLITAESAFQTLSDLIRGYAQAQPEALALRAMGLGPQTRPGIGLPRG